MSKKTLLTILSTFIILILLFLAYFIYLFINPVDSTTDYYPFKSAKGKAAYYAAYEKTLKKWPMPYKKMYVPTLFGKTHVIICGKKSAPPLVMLHQASMSSTVWFPNVGPLSKHFRIYCVDIIGDINKSLAKNSPETREQSAEWLTEILDNLKIKKAYLVGGSYGGFVALNFTMHRPERVKSVVLLAPAASVTAFSTKLLSSLLAPQIFPIRPLAFYSINSLLHKPADKDLMDQCVTGLVTARSQIKVPPSVYSDEELKNIKSPLLLLIGDKEVIYSNPMDGVDRVRNLIPNGQAEIIPDAGHLLSIDQPTLVNARILKFFSK